MRRLVNDEIATLGRNMLAAAKSEPFEFLCECADSRCRRLVPLTLDDFAAAREAGDNVISLEHATDAGLAARIAPLASM
jgi:hypothetical protein